MHDDDIIGIESRAPVIEPGQYWAVVLSVKKIVRFGHGVAEFHFKLVTLGPFYGVRLYGYCTITLKKQARVRAGSKLASWIRVVTDCTGGSTSRFPLGEFKHFLFTVQVETVKKNHRQQQLNPRDQYSTVTQILDLVGPITEEHKKEQRAP